MAKKKIEVEVKEEKKETKKAEKKENKISASKARKLEQAKEREHYEDIIDKLIDDKYEAKKNKDKEKVKEIKKQIKEAKAARNSIGEADTFGGAVRAEMKLVRWPKAKEVCKYSIAVLVFVLFFAGFFYVITALFALFKGAF